MSHRVLNPLFESEAAELPKSPRQFGLELIDFEDASRLNAAWHSRLPVIPDHCKWICFGASFMESIYAVAIWSRPVARLLNDKPWLELRRLAIASDAPKFTASWMLGKMVRQLAVMRPDIAVLISYQDTAVHKGTIYKAAGWEAVSLSSGGSWNRTTGSRVRSLTQTKARKVRWQKVIREALDRAPQEAA